MCRLLWLFGLVAVLASAATAADGESISLRAAPTISGTFVFSCSGCPQNPSGPSLFIVGADGTRLRELPAPAPYHPRWSPRGTSLTFSSRFTDIWTIDAATARARQITGSGETSPNDDTPAWSPDGKTIAFARSGSLYAVTLRTGEVKLLVASSRAATSFSSPDWSPDGRRIAFHRNGQQLYVADASGKHPRRLPLRVEARYPRWSPDGKAIAFITFGSKPALMVCQADGSHPRVITSRRDINWNVNPAWSPDGRRLAFVITKTFDVQNGFAGNEIVTVRLDGTGARGVKIPDVPLDSYSEFYGIDWTRRSVTAR